MRDRYRQGRWRQGTADWSGWEGRNRGDWRRNDGDRDGWTGDWRGWATGPGPIPQLSDWIARHIPGLYRLPEYGRLAGVCAGLAHALMIRPKALRILTGIGLLMAFPLVATSYLLLALCLPVRRVGGGDYVDATIPGEPPQPAAPAADPAPPPDDPGGPATIDRLRGLDQRLAAIERHVLSEEFKLRRQFRDLER